MSDAKVYVFVHGADGKAIGAGALIGTWKRKDIPGTFAGMFADYDRDGDPKERLAVVEGGGGGLSYRVVPVTQISDFPDHPGYRKGNAS